MSMMIGRCYFEGRQPSNARTMGNITFYFDGAFPNSYSLFGGVHRLEFEGDVWVVYGPYYNGDPRVEVTSRYGTVQEGYL